MKILRLLALLSLVCTPAFAQWQTPTHSVPIGRGLGMTGFKSAVPGVAGQVLTSNGAAADPTFQLLPVPAPTSHAGAYALASSDCGHDQLLTGNVQFNVTVNASNTYTCSRFKLKNIDVYTGPGSGRGKLVNASGLCSFWLMPGQFVELIANSTGWTTDKQLFAPDNGNALGPAVNICYVERWKLPTTAVLNVGGTGSSDTANDGLASGTGALATINHALMVSCNAVDMQYQTYTVQVADGTYTLPVHLCNMVGYSTLGGHSELILSGNTTTLGNTFLNTGSTGAISAVGLYTPWRVQGFKISTTGTTASCVQADGHSFLYVGNNNYAGCGDAILLASYDSFLEAVDNFTISGNATFGFASQYHSLVDTALVTVTLTGTPAFSNTFALAQNNSDIEAVSMTTTGSATGQRYSSFLGSTINTGTGDGNFFPGSSAGSVNCSSSTISGSVITSLSTCGFYN